MGKYIVALDQGTTSSRAIVFDELGQIVAVSNREFEQIYPQPGWIEHDPMDILNTQVEVLREVMVRAGLNASNLSGVGITNQRETTIIWDKKTGEPIYNAIVWQCRRTASEIEKLEKDGMAGTIKEKTGLILDPYFSGTKIKWILDHVPGSRERAARGELMFGTVDTWLIWNLTGSRAHVTDYSNASRTMLYNIHDLCWDEELLRAFDIPIELMPEVLPSSGLFGVMNTSILGGEVPIFGVAGDQHAALFGQTCFEPGMAKNTYGTGCFLLMNTGTEPVNSKNNLLTTIAWGIGGQVEYALEGSIFMGGATVQWLRDEMGLIEKSSDSEEVARSVPDTDGVVLVPAFTGLGAPHWDMYSRGIIVGLTRGAGRAHIVRAALEAIAYQTRDVLTAMEADSGIKLNTLRVDGGASANGFLMQFQSDILNVTVERPKIIETTALGAACLAGLAAGVWKDREELNARYAISAHFDPQMPEQEREGKYRLWQRAVKRSLGWAEQ